MRISQYNNHYNNLNNIKTANRISKANNVSFGGNTIFYAMQRVQKVRTNPLRGILNKSVKLFNRKSKDNSLKSEFLMQLNKRFSAKNFYASAADRENYELVNEIFKSIPKPTSVHVAVVSGLDVSMRELKDIFKHAQSDDKLKYILKFNNEILKNKKESCQNFLSSLVKSPFINEYMKNFGKYKSYFLSSPSNAKSVEYLDRRVSEHSFNSKVFDNILKRKEKKEFYSSIFKDTAVLNKNVYARISTPERDKMLKNIGFDIAFSRKEIAAGTDKILLEILKSTTKKNFYVRKRIYEKNPISSGIDTKEHLGKLLTIYKRIDNSSDLFGFFKKADKHKLEFNGLDEAIKVIDAVSCKKLNMFFDNVNNIFSKTNARNRVEILKNEIENAMFSTPEYDAYIRRKKEAKFKAGESKVSKYKRYISNEITKFRYKVIFKNAESSEIKIPEKTETVVKQADIAKPAPVKVAKKKVKPQTNDIEKPLTLSMKRKLAVKQNVLDLVTKKLGSKTLSEQQLDYNKYATKIRLNMLPEIFASVADTRKADRLAGKKKSLSSNKDVVELFKNINGKNKKYVNYLLKKRTEQGTRMFEVKEIIDIINHTERHIRFKKISPEGFTSKQAKAYYDELLFNVQRSEKLKDTVGDKKIVNAENKTFAIYS